MDLTEHLLQLHLKDIFLCLVWQLFSFRVYRHHRRLLHSTVFVFFFLSQLWIRLCFLGGGGPFLLHCPQLSPLAVL